MNWRKKKTSINSCRFLTSNTQLPPRSVSPCPGPRGRFTDGSFKVGFLLGSNDLGDQKASYFPLYWVFIRDPYNGLLVYNNPYTIGWYNPLYNPTNQGLFHRSSVQSSDWGEVGSFIFALSTLFHAKCLKYVSKGAKTKTVEQTAGTATNFPWFGPPLSTLPSPQGYSSSLHVVRGTRHCIGIRINRHGRRITQASGCWEIWWFRGPAWFWSDINIHIIWLVVSTHLTNMCQKWKSSPIFEVKITNIWNHHPVIQTIYVMKIHMILYPVHMCRY